MIKYILILTILAGMLTAQEIDLNGSLDQPIKASATPAMGVRIVGSYFQSWNMKRVIDFLCTLPQISTAEEEYTTTHCVNGWDTTGNFTVFTSFWSANQNLNGIKNELNSYTSAFPASSEVFAASTTNGYTAYYDWYGKTVASGTNDGTDWDTFERNKWGNSQTSSNLNFYAGRNTGALPETATYQSRDELQITVSNGTKYTIYAYDTTTPLVLDMDGNGCLDASCGQWLPHAANSKFIPFDINGDGFDELIEWVGANDGLLIRYTHGEKVTGKNLFGDALGFSNGFEQLATYDTNCDGKIAGDELNGLSVWQDANENAIADANEVVAVSDLGITQINTHHTNMVSSFVKDGQEYTVWDWHPVTSIAKKMQE